MDANSVEKGRKMTIAVVGATGNTWRAVVKELKQLGQDPVCIVRNAEKAREVIVETSSGEVDMSQLPPSWLRLSILQEVSCQYSVKCSLEIMALVLAADKDVTPGGTEYRVSGL
jgi:NAD(P)-dependent dehydrogenase (short-subunit alcohol dehydrogenase family)